ncbi:MAG: hypothetical protein EP344_14555 [Bacteroidetes bacterium]|nr:MAG: hypothetical protein EP344_14555 [Bacteroidota bacterium]
MKHAVLILLLWCMSGYSVPAQKMVSAAQAAGFAAIDARARKIRLTDGDIIRLTDSLTRPYTTEMDQARAIFAWVTAHIAYDCGGENRLEAEPEEALHPHFYSQIQLENILKTRRTRCDGFSFLFKLMCNLRGIYVSRVEGYGRFRGERVDPATVQPNHAWNAALLDGHWYEIDPTIGAGSCSGTRFARQRNDACFGLSPELLRERYIPVYDHRQLHNQGRLPVGH